MDEEQEEEEEEEEEEDRASERARAGETYVKPKQVFRL